MGYRLHLLWEHSLFFATNKLNSSKYSALFSNQGGEGEGEDDAGYSTPDEINDERSYRDHWQWFATICHLATTPILNITGDKRITDLNYIFVLNYLAHEKDINYIKRQQEKRSINKRKLK